ncbi:MAG: hypothetical protein E7525_02020 [Ruminococcaceae bacterium]|nr:hypothetical protein [Oscillospiraceae bacterium]
MEKFLTYKGKPIVRQGDTIYYGNTDEKFIIMMKVKSTVKVGGEDVADKIAIQLIHTDSDMDPAKRVVKQSEKQGLYNAMDIAAVWLDRALKD